MQLQNPFSNFSDETKQNDSDNDNNPINIINFQNSPKEIESNINKNNQTEKEKENIENNNKFELNDINHININENLNNSHFPPKSPKNNSKSIFDFSNTEEKMDNLKILIAITHLLTKILKKMKIIALIILTMRIFLIILFIIIIKKIIIKSLIIIIK